MTLDLALTDMLIVVGEQVECCSVGKYRGVNSHKVAVACRRVEDAEAGIGRHEFQLTVEDNNTLKHLHINHDSLPAS